MKIKSFRLTISLVFVTLMLITKNVIAQTCEVTLSTTFAGNTSIDGNMFNITAINTVTITGFDGNVAGTGDIQIYYKSGSYIGSQTNPGPWTFVGGVAVTSGGIGVPTPITVTVNLTIPAGQTYGFYITGNGTGASLEQINGTNEDSVYVSDVNLQIKEGAGIQYSFSAPTAPRVWNGIVHYTSVLSTTTSKTDVTCYWK